MSPNLQSTSFLLDESGSPLQILLNEDSFTVSKYQLPDSFNSQKLEDFLFTQLMHHHIYPLIRGIGLLGLASENMLLTGISDNIEALYEKFDTKLNCLGNAYTKVTAFLPDLLFLTQRLNHISRQVHVHNHIINAKYYSEQLIKPVPGETVHKRYFNGGTTEIGLRGFDINTDLEIVHNWVNHEKAKKFWEMNGPIKDLEQAYIKHLGVDYSHPYIGTLNGEPIFTLELYWAVKDEVGKYYPFHLGDYGFHMLIAPAKQHISNFSCYALTMCIEYFFSFSQVHRMIGEASVEHMGTHNLITKVGCEFEKALVLPYKTSNLTFLTREMYYDYVNNILQNSKKEIQVNVY